MNSIFASLGPMVRLMGGAGGGGDSGSTMMSFLPLVAIIAILYFLILRPQKKRQQETQKMLAAVRKGDRVITIGGIHGIIQSVKETTVIIKVDENVKLEFNRGAIQSVVSQGREEKEEKKVEASEEKDEETSGTEEKNE